MKWESIICPRYVKRLNIEIRNTSIFEIRVLLSLLTAPRNRERKNPIKYYSNKKHARYLVYNIFYLWKALWVEM